jgi:hypothetical protein
MTNLLIDIQKFIQNLVFIILVKYWLLYKEEEKNFDINLIEKLLTSKINEYLLNMGCYSIILNLYSIQKENNKKDLIINQKFIKLNNNNINLKDFKLKNIHIQEKYNNPYQDVIDLIIKFIKEEFITKKLLYLSESLQQIQISLNNYYNIEENMINDFDENDIILSTDELLPIYIYCLIKSNFKDPYSTLNFIEDYCNEEQLKGIEGK